MSRYTLTLAIAVLLLAGCGQKGPLYLPQPEQGESSSTP